MRVATGIRKFMGLMFRTKYTEPLIFRFNIPVYIPIHSWFVFFPFQAIWSFSDGRKEDMIVKPFQKGIYPPSEKPFISLTEIPIN